METLAAGRAVPEDFGTVVAELQSWGWIMPSGSELTGIGFRHAGVGSLGVLG